MQGNGNSWKYKTFPLGPANAVSQNSGLMWSSILAKIKAWAAKILSEITADDYWEQFIHVRAQFRFDDEEVIDNSPITSREARIIREKLAVLESSILENYAHNKDQQKVIRKKFEYLDNCIERQGKTDWIHTMVGVLASMAVALGVSAANGDKFWELVKNVLGSSVSLLTGG